MTTTRTRAQRIRLDAAGPELECRWCDEYWPLTREWWNVARDGRVEADICRSCVQERDRLRHAIALMQSEKRARKLAANRVYKATIARRHPELVGALERERRAVSRDSQRRRAA